MTQEKMNINSRTLWSNLWNDSPGANKNQHVEVIYSKDVAPTPFQVTAHIIKYKDSQGPKGRLMLRSDTPKLS